MIEPVVDYCTSYLSMLTNLLEEVNFRKRVLGTMYLVLQVNRVY